MPSLLSFSPTNCTTQPNVEQKFQTQARGIASNLSLLLVQAVVHFSGIDSIDSFQFLHPEREAMHRLPQNAPRYSRSFRLIHSVIYMDAIARAKVSMLLCLR